jgi:hypothetical protein
MEYNDIINLPHHEPKNHKRMSRISRAAQFGAFRALTGHEDSVKESARYTEQETYLDENAIEKINERLIIVYNMIEQKPEIEITYFEPDMLKDGGEIKTFKGYIEKIDPYEKIIVTPEKVIININRILDINGEVFDKMYLS